MGETYATKKYSDAANSSTKNIALAPFTDTISNKKQTEIITTPIHKQSSDKTLSSSSALVRNSITIAPSNQQSLDCALNLNEYSFKKPQILSDKNSNVDIKNKYAQNDPWKLNEFKMGAGVKRKCQSMTEFDYSLPRPLSDRSHLKRIITTEAPKKIFQHQTNVTNYFSNPSRTSNIIESSEPIGNSTIVEDQSNDKNNEKFIFRYVSYMIFPKNLISIKMLFTFYIFSIDDILNDFEESEKENNNDVLITKSPPIKSIRQTFNKSGHLSPINHDNIACDSIDVNNQYETRRNNLLQQLQQNSAKENSEFVKNTLVEQFSFY